MPHSFFSRRAILALFGGALGIAAATTAYADSLASSAASAASQSVGSVSTSLQGSSNSSSGGKTVAEGDYEVTNVAAAPDKAGMLRLRLKAAAARTAERDDDGTFTLVLPQAALGERGIASGETVQVRHRPYGYEFARASNREPFFLVLADAWMRELDARPI
jgi:hypothetical protein